MKPAPAEAVIVTWAYHPDSAAIHQHQLLTGLPPCDSRLDRGICGTMHVR
jgi:hypothetical protein